MNAQTPLLIMVNQTVARKQLSKVLFVLLFLLSLTQCGFNTVRFEGIPIRGKVEFFSEKFENCKHFKVSEKKHIESRTGFIPQYKGEFYHGSPFASLRECYVIIGRNKDNTVTNIGVYKYFDGNWEEMKSAFESVRDGLTEEFGTLDFGGYSDTFFFMFPTKEEHPYCQWAINDWEITLEYQPDDDGTPVLQITYFLW